MCFKLNPTLRIGIICIYAYNDSPARIHLWKKIHEAQLPIAQWILSRDFNQVEDPNDRIGGDIHIGINSQEVEEWGKMIFTLDLQDSFLVQQILKSSNKRFFWCNGHLDITRREARLDRFYVDSTLAMKGGSMDISVHLTHVSDHAALFLTIALADRPRRKPHMRFNQCIMHSHKAELLRTWNHDRDCIVQTNWRGQMEQIMKSVKLISDDVTKTERKK